MESGSHGAIWTPGEIKACEASMEQLRTIRAALLEDSHAPRFDHVSNYVKCSVQLLCFLQLSGNSCTCSRMRRRLPMLKISRRLSNKPSATQIVTPFDQRWQLREPDRENIEIGMGEREWVKACKGDGMLEGTRLQFNRKPWFHPHSVPESLHFSPPTIRDLLFAMKQ